MSTADQDMFDKMLSSTTLKKIKEENEIFQNGYSAGFAAGKHAAYLEFMDKISDDGK